MDGNSLSFMAFAALFAVALVSRVPPVERRLVAAANRAGERMAESLRREPELDPLVAQMLAVRRRERLQDDLRRLRRLIACDEEMSATRQLGNRLAYQWVVREQARLAALPVDVTAGPALLDSPIWVDVEDDPDRWASPVAQPRPQPPARVSSSAVEVIDIRW